MLYPIPNTGQGIIYGLNCEGVWVGWPRDCLPNTIAQAETKSVANIRFTLSIPPLSYNGEGMGTSCQKHRDLIDSGFGHWKKSLKVGDLQNPNAAPQFPPCKINVPFMPVAAASGGGRPK